MNAERLHAIAEVIRRDLAHTDALGLLDRLSSALRSQVQEPQQPAHQQQVSDLRAQVQTALAAAPSNEFSPLWRELATELGFGGLLGTELAARVEEVFLRNEITPSIAADEIAAMAEQLRVLTASLDGLVTGLTGLKIGQEELAPGEVEIGILIPRRAVDNELRPLGEEFVELDRILRQFAELATGSRPDFEVRAISSSAFSVFLDSAEGTALVVAVALERLLKAYQTILDIRIKHGELKEMKVPKGVLGALAEHANERMRTESEATADDLLNEFGGDLDESRRHEMRTELSKALRALANRIDKGYNIDVRTGEIEAAEDDESEGVDQQDAEINERIRSLRPGLTFINTTGEPILELPEDTDPDGEGDESEAPQDGDTREEDKG